MKITQFFYLVISLLLVVGSVPKSVVAEPYVPKHNEVILTEFDSGIKDTELAHIRSLKKVKRSDPGNYRIALDLSRAYINLALQQEDPRYYGLAEAAIKPWWNTIEYLDILLLKAKILQFNHQFSEAIIVLDHIIASSSSAQALLMRANISQVLGRYEETTEDCKKLLLKTSSLITASCFLSVSGFTSDEEKSKNLVNQLSNMIDLSTNESLYVKLWALGLAAESASLMHHWEVAEKLLLQGLELKSDDSYLLSLYADLLLKQNRFQACINLLQSDLNKTTLLIRFLAAKNQLSQLEAEKKYQENLDLRIREDLIKGDNRHLREYAYYQLYIKNNYETAFLNALENWQHQKEMSDALILYRAAEKFQQNDVLVLLHDWATTNHVQVNFSKESLKI